MAVTVKAEHLIGYISALNMVIKAESEPSKKQNKKQLFH